VLSCIRLAVGAQGSVSFRIQVENSLPLLLVASTHPCHSGEGGTKTACQRFLQTRCKMGATPDQSCFHSFMCWFGLANLPPVHGRGPWLVLLLCPPPLQLNIHFDTVGVNQQQVFASAARMAPTKECCCQLLILLCQRGSAACCPAKCSPVVSSSREGSNPLQCENLMSVVPGERLQLIA